jgi:16S rRNA (cytosine967-C5)-methyltransferase
MTTARALALRTIQKAQKGAFVNDLLNAELNRSALEPRDRRFVTELVYGTVRQQRALEFVWRQLISRDPSAEEFAGLQLGAYQLLHLDVDTHAAVNETVGALALRARPMVNAVLRKIADRRAEPIVWPNIATELSYPDWVVDRLIADLGHDDAVEMLRAMNQPATATSRDDGYTQDLGSQWVATLAGAQQGERVLDVCAAPGGKATALATAVGPTGLVIAGDRTTSRLRRLSENMNSYAPDNSVVAQLDGLTLPIAAGSMDRVLVDAPCSGLGVLARRPDARWRVQQSDVTSLGAQQLELLTAATDTVRDGGTLVYSVCTVTRAETDDVVQALLQRDPRLTLDTSAWVGQATALGFDRTDTGVRILCQRHATDAMFVARLRVNA